jgi:hypothetical protein
MGKRVLLTSTKGRDNPEKIGNGNGFLSPALKCACLESFGAA